MDISTEQINPFLLPSVTYRQRDQLPAESGIYFAIVNGEILYIGQSSSINYRWKCHEKRHELKTYGDITIAYFTTIEKDEDERCQLEEAYIDRFRPVLNGTLKHLRARESTLLQIDSENKVKLMHMCIDKGIKLSDIVNEAIEQYIDSEDRQKKKSSCKSRQSRKDKPTTARQLQLALE